MNRHLWSSGFTAENLSGVKFYSDVFGFLGADVIVRLYVIVLHIYAMFHMCVRVGGLFTSAAMQAGSCHSTSHFTLTGSCPPLCHYSDSHSVLPAGSQSRLCHQHREAGGCCCAERGKVFFLWFLDSCDLFSLFWFDSAMRQTHQARRDELMSWAVVYALITQHCLCLDVHLLPFLCVPVDVSACSSHPNSYKRPSRAPLAAGWDSVPLWPASEMPAGKPRSTSLPHPPPPHRPATETCGGRAAEGKGSWWGGSPGMTPEGRRHLSEEPLGLLLLLHPTVAARELRGSLRTELPPPRRPLTHLHLPLLLCYSPVQSSRCRRCRRRGKVRSQMSPYEGWES